MFFYYDWTYILVLIGAALSVWASMNVTSVINKYRRVPSSSGITAAEAAKRILNANDIYGVTIKKISSGPSDYYNVATKELCLLADNYNSTSVASIGIAAHECGHAIQDATGYGLLTLKNVLAPISALGSRLGLYILLIGFLFGLQDVTKLGILLFSLGVVITLILLPIEFNASNRAIRILEEQRLLTANEISGASAVLRAAGLTYVAAAAASILSLLRIILLTNNRRNRR